MSRLFEFIMNLLGAWGWFTVGMLFILATIATGIIYYVRESPDWVTLLYSMRNFAYLILLGLACVGLASLKGF